MLKNLYWLPFLVILNFFDKISATSGFKFNSRGHMKYIYVKNILSQRRLPQK